MGQARGCSCRFPSAAAQRDALGAPVFPRGCRTARHRRGTDPSGQRGGVANYSGHNMRASDLARFLNTSARPGQGAPRGLAEGPWFAR